MATSGNLAIAIKILLKTNPIVDIYVSILANNYWGEWIWVLQKILIATGDSPESAEVFKSGLTLAEKYGAQISILHVLNLFQSGFEAIGTPLMGVTYPMMNDVTIHEYQKELQDRVKQGMERLESYATEARARNITVEIFQNMGNAGRMICETAKNYSADLIVIGRNQRSVLSEIFLGSTSNYVLHHAPCSVMVIQQK